MLEIEIVTVFLTNFCRVKILNALLELDGKKRVSHPLASCIEYGRDKSGMATTVLKVAYWRRQELPQAVEYPEEHALERSSGIPLSVGHHPYSSNMLVTSDFTTTVLVSGHGGVGIDADSDFDEFSDGDAPISSCNSSSSSTASSHNGPASSTGPSTVGVGASYSSGSRYGSKYM